MSWKEQFQKKIEKTKQKKKMIKRKRELKDEEIRETDTRMLKGILPRVKNVFKKFAKALPSEWKNGIKKYNFRKETYGRGVFWVNYGERSSYTITVEVAGRLTLDRTPTINVIVREKYPYRAYSLEFLQKYSPKNVSSFNRGIDVGNVEASIPVKDFTEAKLAQTIMDFYDAVQWAIADAYRS